MKVAVIGAGSFGTTMGALAAHNAETWVWARRERSPGRLMRSTKNPWFHPGVKLPQTMRSTSDLELCLREADAVVMAVPTQFVRDGADLRGRVIDS